MHRIPRHESKCAAFHGHRYAAELECWAESLDDRGRVVDFGVIKERVGSWIDQHWDHTAILMRGDPDPAVPAIVASNASFGRPVYFMDVPPTAENIAAALAEISQELLADTGVKLLSIRLYETPNGSATWRASS